MGNDIDCTRATQDVILPSIRLLVSRILINSIGHVTIDANVKSILQAISLINLDTSSYSMTASPCARIDIVEQSWLVVLVVVMVAGVDVALCCGCVDWL